MGKNKDVKSLVTQSVGSLNRVTQGSVIGTATTAFTIYSHVDGFLNLSKTIKALAAAWRDIIAFPWQWVAGLVGFHVQKTTAGLFTVLLATLLVVWTARKETRQEMTKEFRVLAIVVCAIIGFLYSTQIIVPALYDAKRPVFEVTGIAIEALAAMFYTRVDTIDVPSWMMIVGTAAVILFSYVMLLVWPFHKKVSGKSALRFWVGVSLGLIFLIVIADRVLHSFLPISLTGESVLEEAVLILAVGAIIIAPFVSSVYLSDPFTSARRNFSIATLILLIFALDCAARAMEWIVVHVSAAPPG